MMQITEDTPPDMLAGAMDLTVHLPTGRNVKMAVERSTPMMDLLVQITTAHQLQLSNYTLQALGMAPSSDHRDKILPYKPNTPIGTLDTQHIKVVAKSRTIPVPKNVQPGHQPFESTFRLKVHLPRNQLYVARVSRNVMLEDIMNRVCEEKKLDPMKYEFKHPGNLDETLDPKLTLSDYQITEIYVVAKGTASLSQAFSSSDIMALRKEEERKQMHNKTGGGVFNLIFRRGKSSMGSGSISSDTRSISPTHSDDSRSVTPPGVVQQPILPPPKQDPPPERPKPPQRKRRPAPKPPQQVPQAEDTRTNTDSTRSVDENDRTSSEDARRLSEEKPSSNISNVSEVSELQTRKVEGGLVISHSRTSSDSSGYHEASVLSENCNTSLPRRPKSAFVGSGDMEKLSKMHSQSSSNLSKMASHSKSTTSLGMTGRKKKAAPPPPPAIRASNPQINIESASPVVASQSTSITATPITPLDILVAQSAPKPLPRSKCRAPEAPQIRPIPRPRSEIVTSSRIETIEEINEEKGSNKSEIITTSNNTFKVRIGELARPSSEIITTTLIKNEDIVDIQNEGPDDDKSEGPGDIKNMKEIIDEKVRPGREIIATDIFKNEGLVDIKKENSLDIKNDIELQTDKSLTEIGTTTNVDKLDDNNNVEPDLQNGKEEQSKLAYSKILELQRQSHQIIFTLPEFKTQISQTKLKEESPTNVVTKTDVKNDITREPIESKHESEKEDIANKNITVEVEQEKPKEDIPEIYKKDDKKLPEVVGMIPKTPKDKKGNKFDSFGKRRFQNSSLVGSFEDDSTSLKSDSISTRTSITSALGTFNFIDELSDLDDKVFSGSVSSKNKVSLKEEAFNELYGIHYLEDVNLEKNQSISSLKSLRSLPGFLNTNSGIKRWNNFEELDDLFIDSKGAKNGWVVGESDAGARHDDDQDFDLPRPKNKSLESLTSHQALDSLGSSNNVLSEIKDETKPFGSTDSGIAQETNEKLSETEEYRTITPPPPPLFLDEPPLEKEPKSEEKLLLDKEKDNAEIGKNIVPLSVEKDEVETKEIERLIEPTNEILRVNSDFNEIDWQYQLPSPPKAFRDSSPVNFNETNSPDSHSVSDFKDSVVTSPDLFEKLNSINDTRSVTTFDTQSVATFVADEPPLNSLTLENLERRKSLVYNRELSTSLKVTEEDKMDPYTSSLNKFESTFIELQKSSQKDNREPKFIQKSSQASSNTLPNFKISTYDRPKEKIKVFEDDTIRSNENGIKNIKKNYVESGYATNKIYSNLNRSYLTSSMENIAIRKNSIENKTGEREYTFFRPEPMNMAKNSGPTSSMYRSESFSTDNTWSPIKPVSRSKSYLTLNGNNKYKIERQTSEEKVVERSNSLYDVSGLQSLGVIRLIQNKLNTPTSSLENINHHQEKYEKPKINTESQKEAHLKIKPEEIDQKSNTEKIYKYQGPPSINMGTWSERPKMPVSVKEDEDYTLGNNISSKLIVNTSNNNITSNNSIEIRKHSEVESTKPNISIKVNGTEVPTPTHETKSGNVVIKIGSASSQPKLIDNKRFINHTTATGYRKPFTDINKNQRPHSIALGSEFDISRVPVVRSVELKKPYKDFGNTSVTQIYQSETNQQHEYLDDKRPFSMFGGLKPATAPVVRGFKTLPREKEAFTANSQVPFSQVTLRRTESSKLFEENNAKISECQNNVKQSPNEFNPPPPPPPMMPKVNLKKPVIRQIAPVEDPRDQLLSAIRSFGGKKGLRPNKV